jgi:hypothetical protein
MASAGIGFTRGLGFEYVPPEYLRVFSLSEESGLRIPLTLEVDSLV